MVNSKMAADHIQFITPYSIYGISRWGVIFKKTQVFCFWTLAHKKISGLVALRQSFPKIKIFGWGSPQFWRILGQSWQFQPPYLLRKRFWGQILILNDRGLGATLFSKVVHLSPPLILGKFSNFGVFKIWPLKSRKPRGQGLKGLACRLCKKYI